jgi:hypothetical protein
LDKHPAELLRLLAVQVQKLVLHVQLAFGDFPERWAELVAYVELLLVIMVPVQTVAQEMLQILLVILPLWVEMVVMAVPVE